MDSVDIVEKQKYILCRLISITNILQAVGDKYLAGDDITIRQWLLTAAIAQFGDKVPTIGEVSRIMGSSHQNVKQLAGNLEEKGFINMVEDQEDRRARRLELTQKCYYFWHKRQNEIRSFLIDIFKDLSQEEINILCECLARMYERILKMEESLNP